MKNDFLVKIDPDCSNCNPISMPAKKGDVGYDLKVWIESEVINNKSSFCSINYIARNSAAYIYPRTDLSMDNENPSVFILPQSMLNIRTGVCVKLPEGYWGSINPRSSTFAKRKLFIMGGIIDEGYIGELSIFIWNPTQESIQIFNGERLAQLIISSRVTPKINIVDQLPQTERGVTCFGSTDQ